MKAAEGIGSRVSSSENVQKIVSVAYYRGSTMLKVGTAVWHAGQMVGGAGGREGGAQIKDN